MYCSYPTGRVRMKFSPHVKVKNSFPRGRRPQGEEFFTFTRGENSFLPTRLGKSSILMYFCNKLEGEKNLRKSFFFPIGIKKNLSFSLLRNFYMKSFIKKLTCREKEWIFFFPIGKKYKIFSLQGKRMKFSLYREKEWFFSPSFLLLKYVRMILLSKFSPGR